MLPTTTIVSDEERLYAVVEGIVDQWLADYLNPDTWHHGPRHLVDQIDTLAINFKLPPPIRTGPPDGNQGTLF